jgi:hypothetical protein
VIAACGEVAAPSVPDLSVPGRAVQRLARYTDKCRSLREHFPIPCARPYASAIGWVLMRLPSREQEAGPVETAIRPPCLGHFSFNLTAGFKCSHVSR